MTDPAPGLTTPAHDKDMARDFLACLDPNASKFTFQFFSDGPNSYAPEILHGTLDGIWSKVQALNSPQRGVGVFVAINETDLAGRRSENVVRPRALFADADGNEQVARCIETLSASGVNPSIIVKSGRGLHIYYFCDDVPLDQFSACQKSLSKNLGTDPAVNDLPRVMRLPGTLHLKDLTNPRLVKLCRPNNQLRRCWKFSELVEKLGLSSTAPAPAPSQAHRLPDTFTPEARERIQKLFGHICFESASAGLETNIEEVRSAVSAIPSSAISTEPEWMKLARGLAHEAAIHKHQAEQLWEILTRLRAARRNTTKRTTEAAG